MLYALEAAAFLLKCFVLRCTEVVFFLLTFLQSSIWAQYLEIIAESDNMGLAVWNESWGLGWVGRM